MWFLNYGYVYYYISKLRRQQVDVMQNHMYCETKLDKGKTLVRKVRWVKRLSFCFYGIGLYGKHNRRCEVCKYRHLASVLFWHIT